MKREEKKVTFLFYLRSWIKISIAKCKLIENVQETRMDHNLNVSVTTQIQCKHEYEYVLQYLWWETRVLMSYHFHRGKFVSVSVKFPRVYCFHCSNFRYPTAGTGTTFTPNLVLTIRPSCLTDSAWNEINRASSESSRKRKRSDRSFDS